LETFILHDPVTQDELKKKVVVVHHHLSSNEQGRNKEPG
jgi:hypothetical protein